MNALLASVTRIRACVGVAECTVYVLAYDDASVLSATAMEVLSDDERVRAVRFAREGDRARFVRRRIFVRSVLGSHLGEPAASVRLAIGPYGKPTVAVPPGTAPTVHFSVSTAGPYAAMAVSDRPVGIDIEYLRSGVWDAAAASLVLSAEEIEWVQAQTDRDGAFLRCWTRKEAAAKLDGSGLFDGIERITLTPECLDGRTALAELTCIEGLQVALAARA